MNRSVGGDFFGDPAKKNDATDLTREQGKCRLDLIAGKRLRSPYELRRIDLEPGQNARNQAAARFEHVNLIPHTSRTGGLILYQAPAVRSERSALCLSEV